MQCSYCQETGHNKRGCLKREEGIIPPKAGKRKQSPITMQEDKDYDETITLSAMRPNLENELLNSQLTSPMIKDLTVEHIHSKPQISQAGSSVECSYIQEHASTIISVPLTTTTKKGRARIGTHKKKKLH